MPGAPRAITLFAYGLAAGSEPAARGLRALMERRARHERPRAVDAPALSTSEGEDANASLPDGGLPEDTCRGTGR